MLFSLTLVESAGNAAAMALTAATEEALAGGAVGGLVGGVAAGAGGQRAPILDTIAA